MACPFCGCEECYHPLFGNDVECSNANCKAYSPSLYPSLTAPISSIQAEGDEYKGADADDATDPADSAQQDEQPVYLWCNHHHDFGD